MLIFLNFVYFDKKLAVANSVFVEKANIGKSYDMCYITRS